MSVWASGNCAGPMAPLLGEDNLAAGASRDTFFNLFLWCFIWENCPMSKNVHSETGRENPFYTEELSCHLCFITDTWGKIVALKGKSPLKPWEQEVSAHGEPPYGQQLLPFHPGGSWCSQERSPASSLPAAVNPAAWQGHEWCTSGDCHLVGNHTRRLEHPARTANSPRNSNPAGRGRYSAVARSQ